MTPTCAINRARVEGEVLVDDAALEVRQAGSARGASQSFDDLSNIVIVADVNREPDDFLPLPVAPFHILVALTDGEKHGYRLMRDVDAQSDGQVKMGPGTLYGTLKRLTAQGLVEPSPAPRDPGTDDERRRYFRLIDLGAGSCQAEASRLAGLA